MKQIVTFTINPAVDLNASVENVFPDHKLRCDFSHTDPGGGGINVSRVVKRLGGETTAVFCCGGPSGETLRALLDKEGIRQHPIPTEGWTRQNVNIFERSTGQQYRFIMAGPTLSEKEWKTALNAVCAIQPFPEYVVASGSLAPGVPSDIYAQLARVVREAGGKLILDTSGSSLAPALREGIFMVKPSLRELREYGMGRVEHEEDQAKAAMGIVHSCNCEAVVVSLGAAGALFVTESGWERLISPSVAVRSRVGAGDSMVAGIAVGLARGDSLRDAVRYGVAAGAAAVMNPGTELCHRNDVEMLFSQMR